MCNKNIFLNDERFDCSNSENISRLAFLYGNRKTVVAAFLKNQCECNSIQYLTPLDIFELIELKLDYPIPLKGIRNQ